MATRGKKKPADGDELQARLAALRADLEALQGSLKGLAGDAGDAAPTKMIWSRCRIWLNASRIGVKTILFRLENRFANSHWRLAPLRWEPERCSVQFCSGAEMCL